MVTIDTFDQWFVFVRPENVTVTVKLMFPTVQLASVPDVILECD